VSAVCGAYSGVDRSCNLRTQEMQTDPLVTPAASFIALQKRRQAYSDATEDGREPLSTLQRVRELLSALCERYGMKGTAARWRDILVTALDPTPTTGRDACLIDGPDTHLPLSQLECKSPASTRC
jgi:hypothetical protein